MSIRKTVVITKCKSSLSYYIGIMIGVVSEDIPYSPASIYYIILFIKFTLTVSSVNQNLTYYKINIMVSTLQLSHIIIIIMLVITHRDVKTTEISKQELGWKVSVLPIPALHTDHCELLRMCYSKVECRNISSIPIYCL